MKLSDIRAKRQVDVFRSQFGGTCYACRNPITPGTLVIRWDNGVPRHYRCGCNELGVTKRADGTPI